MFYRLKENLFNGAAQKNSKSLFCFLLISFFLLFSSAGFAWREKLNEQLENLRQNLLPSLNTELQTTYEELIANCNSEDIQTAGSALNLLIAKLARDNFSTFVSDLTLIQADIQGEENRSPREEEIYQGFKEQYGDNFFYVEFGETTRGRQQATVYLHNRADGIRHYIQYRTIATAAERATEPLANRNDADPTLGGEAAILPTTSNENGTNTEESSAAIVYLQYLDFQAKS